jgi:hypothetical protein
LKNQRIAILGAGGLGACSALELAERGFEVDLYEAHSQPLRKATYVNEGKIHLGFIYALDHDFHTSQQMILGAIHFISNLKRWIPINPEEVISTPFHYCVHKGSLTNGDSLTAHYKKCVDSFLEVSRHFGRKYLDLEDQIFAERIPKSQIERVVNPEFITDVFATNEYSVEPRTVALLLQRALEDQPKIHLLTNTQVLKVSKFSNRLQVTSIEGGQTKVEEYDQVVNCTWKGLLGIDQTMGVDPLYPNWSFRYKFGNKILIPFESKDYPSCTMVQGPFGDSVNFKGKGGFFSWYPIGRTGWSEDLVPPDWEKMYSQEEKLSIFQQSFEELQKRIPSLKCIKFTLDNVDPAAGVIFALGNKDVDQSTSKLHTRHEVGIRSFGKYHSVNTGKYTLIPYLAMKVADRVEEKI